MEQVTAGREDPVVRWHGHVMLRVPKDFPTKLLFCVSYTQIYPGGAKACLLAGCWHFKKGYFDGPPACKGSLGLT